MRMPGCQWGHVELRCSFRALRLLGRLLQAPEIYTTIPPNPIMMEVIVKIMLELLSVLALASKQIRPGRFSKCAVTYCICCPWLNMPPRNSPKGYSGRARLRPYSKDWID